MLLSHFGICDSPQTGYSLLSLAVAQLGYNLTLNVPENGAWQTDSNYFNICSPLAVKASVNLQNEANWVHPQFFLQAITTISTALKDTLINELN